jgi:hypothetical protein
MVNGSQNSASNSTHLAGDQTARRVARACLINEGQDTQLTFGDGSTIVLKGVTRVDAVFPKSGRPNGSELPPIGGEIGDHG